MNVFVRDNIFANLNKVIYEYIVYKLILEIKGFFHGHNVYFLYHEKYAFCLSFIFLYEVIKVLFLSWKN